VCVDKPNRFDDRRRDIIQNNKSKFFITHLLDEWKFENKNVVSIKIGRTNLANFDTQSKDSVIDISNNSPYMACLIAYHFGARNIGLIGVDFTNNHFNSDDGVHHLNSRMKEIETDYALLYKKLKQKGCNLYNISSTSILNALPKMNIDEFIQKMNE
jgi:hypothetical protein